MSLGFLSPVDFKKSPRQPDEFRGPPQYTRQAHVRCRRKAPHTSFPHPLDCWAGRPDLTITDRPAFSDLELLAHKGLSYTKCYESVWTRLVTGNCCVDGAYCSGHVCTLRSSLINSLGQTKKNLLFPVQRPCELKRGDWEHFFSIFWQKKKICSKTDNISLPNLKKKGEERNCVLPTGHICGHTLDRKQKFFFSLASLKDRW